MSQTTLSEYEYCLVLNNACVFITRPTKGHIMQNIKQA